MDKFFLEDNREKGLYIVKYKYKDDIGEEFADTWLLALTIDSQLHNVMEANRRSFKSIGYELLEYSFTRHAKTHNNQRITFEGMLKEE